MDLSKLEVAIHVHSTESGCKNGPRLVAQKRGSDNLYNVRVENMEGRVAIRSLCKYAFTCSLTIALYERQFHRNRPIL